MENKKKLINHLQLIEFNDLNKHIEDKINPFASNNYDNLKRELIFVMKHNIELEEKYNKLYDSIGNKDDFCDQLESKEIIDFFNKVSELCRSVEYKDTKELLLGIRSRNDTEIKEIYNVVRDDVVNSLPMRVYSHTLEEISKNMKNLNSKNVRNLFKNMIIVEALYRSVLEKSYNILSIVLKDNPIKKIELCLDEKGYDPHSILEDVIHFSEHGFSCNYQLDKREVDLKSLNEKVNTFIEEYKKIETNVSLKRSY